LRAAEQEVEALGWVLTASDLIAALDAAVAPLASLIARMLKSAPAIRRHFALTAFAEGAVDPPPASCATTGSTRCCAM
jgi:hypothetical protein